MSPDPTRTIHEEYHKDNQNGNSEQIIAPKYLEGVKGIARQHIGQEHEVGAPEMVGNGCRNGEKAQNYHAGGYLFQIRLNISADGEHKGEGG